MYNNNKIPDFGKRINLMTVYIPLSKNYFHNSTGTITNRQTISISLFPIFKIKIFLIAQTFYHFLIALEFILLMLVTSTAN